MTVLSNPYVLGYHGCRKSVGEAILRGEKHHLQISDNPWDWLGKGIYFWEADPRRGYEWAEAHCKRVGSGEPFVIGAVIHLGNCLNLMDRTSLKTLGDTFRLYKAFHEKAKPGKPLPVNATSKRHELDCQVINHLHKAIELTLAMDPLPPDPPVPYNTVRGLYQEDDPVFEGSRIMERTHIQISVITAEESIQGYFRVPPGQYLPRK